MYSALLMVRKYVSNVTMSKLVSTLVSHSTQGDPRYDRSSTMCPWTWGKVCGIRTRSWRLATPRKRSKTTILRIYGFWAAGRDREGGCNANPDINLLPEACGASKGEARRSRARHGGGARAGLGGRGRGVRRSRLRLNRLLTLPNSTPGRRLR